MTTDELFALLIGTRFHDHVFMYDGEIISKTDDYVTIRWADGMMADCHRSDEDIAELAAGFDLLDEIADEPVIVAARRT